MKIPRWKCLAVWYSCPYRHVQAFKLSYLHWLLCRLPSNSKAVPLTSEYVVSSVLLVGRDEVGAVDGRTRLHPLQERPQLVLQLNIQHLCLPAGISHVPVGDVPTCRYGKTYDGLQLYYVHASWSCTKLGVSTCHSYLWATMSTCITLAKLTSLPSYTIGQCCQVIVTYRYRLFMSKDIRSSEHYTW